MFHDDRVGQYRGMLGEIVFLANARRQQPLGLQHRSRGQRGKAHVLFFAEARARRSAC